MRLIFQCIFAAISISLSAQNVINLGETPWKFTKVIRSESNLSEGKSFVNNGRTISELNDGKIDTRWRVEAGKEPTLFVDLLEQRSLRDITIVFHGDATRQAVCSIDASNDGNTWTSIHREVSMKCDLNLTNDITNVNNTVGYTAIITSTQVTLPVGGDYRYLRIAVPTGVDTPGQSIACEIGEILIHPVGKNETTEIPFYCNTFDDSSWETVGIPHCYNEHDTYLNATTGERCWRGEAWYRKKITFDKKDRDKAIFLEFYGVNIGMTLYVNGRAIEGNTRVKQPETVTHVGSSLPFAIDITDYIDRDNENLIAIRVSNSKGTFFTWPCFAENEGFGQAMGGIVSPVYLHKKAQVHIPFNRYSPHNKWGTYIGTVEASKEKAVVRIQTNVENTSDTPQSTELRTKFIDKKGKVVFSYSEKSRIEAGKTVLFDHTATIENPHLWYPIGCSGSPYLYTVSNEVYLNGKLVDKKVEKFGIRQITWDDKHCYINGEKCILRGFGYRNNYPGLGAAVPESFRWKDIALIAQCGGNTLRVGHQPPFMEAFEAADTYGVLLIVNSGDNEWALKNEPALTYKREYDRDAVVAFRNHPSVVVWESNNGLAYDGVKYLPSYTLEEVKKWDYIQPRIVLNRDGNPPEWDPDEPIVIGYTNHYHKEQGRPSLNTEVYGTNWSGNPSWCIARFDYDNEKPFSQFYVQNYLDDLRNDACGWIDWMLAETYGEGYTIYLNGKRNQKSLGSCAMDGNRFPKLKYRIYEKALWVPYDQRPGVALQSHWTYSGVQNIDAWSNCPYVEAFLNGKSLGIVTPDKETRRCTWENVTWEAGVVEAVGLDENKKPVCRERIESSGEPYAIEVTIEPQGAKPSGEKFVLKANASDAFIVTAKIVDKEGRWCPRADHELTFEVEGEGVYKGSYNFYIAEGKELSYHAPGDHRLQAEGGLMRAAVRTTFVPGEIKVKVSANGLIAGEASTQSRKVKNDL